MADGKNFLEKQIEIMENDRQLQRCARSGIPVRIECYAPVGNQYPQITIWLDEGRSETVFPAGHYRYSVCIWIKKEEQEKYKLVKMILGHVYRLVNRKADSVSEIDVTKNEGLRVARCVKDGGEILFSKQVGMYYSETIFDCVISEGESFAEEDKGNKEWV